MNVLLGASPEVQAGLPLSLTELGLLSPAAIAAYNNLVAVELSARTAAMNNIAQCVRMERALSAMVATLGRSA